jgi:hypothetical protein
MSYATSAADDLVESAVVRTGIDEPPARNNNRIRLLLRFGLHHGIGTSFSSTAGFGAGVNIMRFGGGP